MHDAMHILAFGGTVQTSLNGRNQNKNTDSALSAQVLQQVQGVFHPVGKP
jgi:hypothetical protein